MISEVLGKYRVTRKIGEGGMGTVYEAEHVEIGKKVALKVLLPTWSSNRQVVTRFFNEARSSALANHPGIVEIFDCGFSTKGRAFLVMELLEGQPLSAILSAEGTLSVRRMTALSRQMASALAAAHSEGIIHRDLKPDNVFVLPDPHAPTGERVKILDFGVAKLAKAQGVNTFVGVMIGTPMYMSPEQCQSSVGVDSRSDVYSVGCIMYEMLCGQPPFVDDDPIHVASLQVREPLPPPRKFRPDIPANVEGLLTRVLHKDREARPQSMHDLRAELDVVWELLPTNELTSGAEFSPSSSGSGGPGVPVVAMPGVLGPAADELPFRASKELSVAGPMPTMPASSAPVADDRPSTAGWRIRLLTSAIVLVVAGAIAVAFLGTEWIATKPARVSVATPLSDDAMTIHIESQPSGATVYREGEDKPVGKTPLKDSCPTHVQCSAFIIELDGYRSHRVKIARGSDSYQRIVLEPIK